MKAFHLKFLLFVAVALAGAHAASNDDDDLFPVSIIHLNDFHAR